MKSIFWRYLFVMVALLLVSFLISGTVFMWRTYTMTVESTQTQLELKTKNLATTTILLAQNDSPATRKLFSSVFTQIFDEGANAVICDMNGSLELYVDRDGIREGSLESIDRSIVAELTRNGIYRQIGNLGGALSDIYYTCGVIVESPDLGFRRLLFVSMPASSPIREVRDVQYTFFLYAAFILFVAIIACYCVTQSMTGAIKKMITVTRSYSRGDFSLKVDEDRDDEIGELAHAINQMGASLDKLEEQRSTFIANVSHELKTPMTTITGFVDGILDGTIPPERQEEYLRRISTDTKRLSRLVIRMLQASRIASGQTQIHPSRIDLCEIVRQTVLGFEQVLREKNIDVQIDLEEEDMYVMADPDTIIQVVFNLTDNACKFTEPGGILAVSVVRDGAKVRTTIANTGGIPDDKLPYIFDRFYKADSSRSVDTNGAGLGLYIVKSILKMHGEDIVARSENGLAKFIFTLPYVGDDLQNVHSSDMRSQRLPGTLKS